MLQNIFKTIDQKVDGEIKQVLKDKDRTLFELERVYQARFKQNKETISREAIKEQQREIDEFCQQKNQEKRFVLQQEKNEIRQRVYEKVKQKVAQLSDKEYEELIKKILGFLPQYSLAEIISDERTAGILKRALADNPAADSLRVGVGLEELGFLVKAGQLTLDMRLSQVLEQEKEKIDPAIIKILFG